MADTVRLSGALGTKWGRGGGGATHRNIQEHRLSTAMYPTDFV